MNVIEYAVFPVAGHGTRFLPATKAMPKELLPIIDKPLIHYAVEEAVAIGCRKLLFVTGRHKRPLEDYFDSNNELNEILQKKGFEELIPKMTDTLPDGVELFFVRQPNALGLGDAILRAQSFVGNNPFLVSLADDFIPQSKNHVPYK